MFDFTKFDGKKPNLVIADGIHEVTLEKVEKKVSKTGTPYLSLWLRMENRQVMFDIINDITADTNELNIYKVYRLSQVLDFKLTNKETLATIQKKLNECLGEVFLADIGTKVNGEFTNNVISAKKEMYYPIDRAPKEAPVEDAKPAPKGKGKSAKGKTSAVVLDEDDIASAIK